MKLSFIRGCGLIVFLLSFSISYSQIASNVSPLKYYNSLIKKLSQPDSLIVYEVYSTWGSGIAYFVSFKNNKKVSGYWINESFTLRELMPLGLLPNDSSSGVSRIIKDSTIDFTEISTYIRQNKIFKLRNELEITQGCEHEDVSDGSFYQLTKIKKDIAIYTRYYEIYNPQCLGVKEYRIFSGLDHLFKKHFKKPEVIKRSLIEEYRNNPK